MSRRGLATLIVVLGCLLAGCSRTGQPEPVPLDRVKAHVQVTEDVGATAVRFSDTSAGADVPCEESAERDHREFHGKNRAAAAASAKKVRPEEAHRYLNAVETYWRGRSKWIDHDTSNPNAYETVFVRMDITEDYEITARYDARDEEVRVVASYRCG